MDDSQGLHKQLAEVYTLLDQIEAYDLESKAEAKLREMGFTNALLAKKTSELSGGWRMRCSLCAALVMEPDVLLLDEPSNALDVLGLEWLKRYLGDRKMYAGTVLLISHDRDFVNSVTDELIVFRKLKFTYFDGNYEEYREMLTIKRQGEANKMDTLNKKKEHLKNYIETQQKASKDKKSKGGDPNKQRLIGSRKKMLAKIDNVGFGTGNGTKFKQASHGFYGLPLALDFDEKPLSIKIPPCEGLTSTATMIQINNISFGWTKDNILVSGFSAQVKGRDRLGIIGKST